MEDTSRPVVVLLERGKERGAVAGRHALQDRQVQLQRAFAGVKTPGGNAGRADRRCPRPRSRSSDTGRVRDAASPAVSRPNGIHALRTVDRDYRGWPALLVEQELVVAHRVHASRSSRVAWKRPIALSCLPNSTNAFAPACRPRYTPSDISLSSTPPASSRLRGPVAASGLADTCLATSGVTMA